MKDSVLILSEYHSTTIKPADELIPQTVVAWVIKKLYK